MILKLPNYSMGILYQDIAYDYCIVEDMKPSFKKFFCSIWVDIRLAFFYVFVSKLYKPDSSKKEEE